MHLLAREYPLRRRGYFFVRQRPQRSSLALWRVRRRPRRAPAAGCRSGSAAAVSFAAAGRYTAVRPGVSKTISGPRITVGSRWLAIFQHSAPTHEQKATAMASISVINTAGRAGRRAGETRPADRAARRRRRDSRPAKPEASPAPER